MPVVMMTVDLSGRVAFITGAAGGIGSALAAAFAANGAAVVVADINAQGATEVASALPDALGVALDDGGWTAGYMM